MTTTIKASKLQKRVHNQLKAAGKILAVQIEAETQALEAAQQELLDPRDRVKLSRIKLYQQGRPLEGKTKPKTFPTAPTPEFVAKRAVQAEVVTPGSGPVPPLNRHRIVAALKPYKEHFTVAEITALDQFYADAEAYGRVKMTANYDSSGGGTPYGRLGGLGNVEERLREQYVRFDWIKTKLLTIDPILLELVRCIILELRAQEHEQLPTVQEMGGILMPSIKDKATRRGVTLGSLKILALILRSLYRLDRAMTKQPSPPRETISIATQPKRAR